MPRHLISDAHEWINEIPTVPIYYLAKPQPRERAWQNQRGKMGSTGLLKASNGDLVHREMSCKGDGITANPLGEVFPLLVTHGEDIVDSITVDLGTC